MHVGSNLPTVNPYITVLADYSTYPLFEFSRQEYELSIGLPGGAEDSHVRLAVTPRDEVRDDLTIRTDVGGCEGKTDRQTDRQTDIIQAIACAILPTGLILVSIFDIF